MIVSASMIDEARPVRSRGRVLCDAPFRDQGSAGSSQQQVGVSVMFSLISTRSRPHSRKVMLLLALSATSESVVSQRFAPYSPGTLQQRFSSEGPIVSHTAHYGHQHFYPRARLIRLRLPGPLHQ